MITSGILQSIFKTISSNISGATIGYAFENDSYPLVLIDRVSVSTEQTKLGLGVFDGNVQIQVVDQSKNPRETIEISKQIFNLLNNNQDLFDEIATLDLKLHSFRLASEEIESINSTEDSFFVQTLNYKFSIADCRDMS